MKKPNAVLHMMGYGLIYGWLLAMLYIWGYLLLTGLISSRLTRWNDIWDALGFAGYSAFIFGALPGIVFGFLTGWILWFVTRHLQPSPHENEYVHVWKRGLKTVGGFSFVAMVSLLILLFGDLFRYSPSLFPWMVLTILPAFIAAGTAMYAVHRYMLRLWAWANVGKAKNDHKLKNQLVYDDVGQDALLITKAESQQDSLTS